MTSVKAFGKEHQVENSNYEDSHFDILTKLEKNELVLYLKNLSDHKAVIHWNESCLIDSNGGTHRIYFKKHIPEQNSFVKITSTSVLPSNSEIIGFVNNMDNEDYIPGHKSVYGNSKIGYSVINSPGRLVNSGLIYGSARRSVKEEVEFYLNNPIKLILAAESEEKKYDYQLNFTINSPDN